MSVTGITGITSITVLFGELRSWSVPRRLIAAGVAAAALVGLTIVSGTLSVIDGAIVFPGAWWGYLLTVVGSGLVGLVVAGYVDAPIGAEATMCDLRWPVLGLIALSLSTDLLTAVPLLEGFVRPVVAVAAVVLLVWALRERLQSEHDATTGADGEVCTTCRPLFPLAQGRSGQ
ncbi:hypothetical protein E3T24_09890 [Cryobacterium sp. TmT2-59]|uniref:hypothetical protein n=1 Tax=Cryobacterium sp. TmT2-59 TaxID=1259264 RepID=UPI0010690159|nr:hypothetical protein [Cryobacterium sp. TmT2-59]TFC84737.1 hypothetical protein E3T24_09890 [Cryobacterium sp. TmT2-59]